MAIDNDGEDDETAHEGKVGRRDRPEAGHAETFGAKGFTPAHRLSRFTGEARNANRREKRSVLARSGAALDAVAVVMRLAAGVDAGSSRSELLREQVLAVPVEGDRLCESSARRVGSCR